MSTVQTLDHSLLACSGPVASHLSYYSYLGTLYSLFPQCSRSFRLRVWVLRQPELLASISYTSRIRPKITHLRETDLALRRYGRPAAHCDARQDHRWQCAETRGEAEAQGEEASNDADGCAHMKSYQVNFDITLEV